MDRRLSSVLPMLRIPVVALMLLLPFALRVLPANWPQFRGPNACGVAAGKFPVNFGPETNVAWRAAVAGGHSSPVIWGEHLFLTGFDGSKLQILCLARSNGVVRWRRSVEPGRIERSARNSHPATSTPCTDGTNLFVYFGSFGALSFGLDGSERWRAPLPPLITQHGASSSPVLAGEMVVLLRDSDVGSHLLALRKSDGTVIWQTARPDARRSFSTPLVLGDEIIVAGTLRIAAYESSAGKERWTIRGLPNEICSSPVSGGGLVYAAGWTPGSGVATMPTFGALLERGDANRDGKLSRQEAPNGPARQHFVYIDSNKDGVIDSAEWESMASIFSRSENAVIAIRPKGSGDMTGTNVVWKRHRGLPYVPTPLYYDNRLYLVRNGGLVSCLKSSDGSPLYEEERIGALGDYYASPVGAGGRICMISQAGVATVIAAGDQLEVLAQNRLGEEVLATPALADNTLYIRTATKVYAFREAK